MPAVFHFRLHKVLELRERELRDARIALARALDTERQRERELESARIERHAHDEGLRGVDVDPLTPLDLRARVATTEALAAREARLAGLLEAAHQGSEAARTDAVEAQRAVETMRRLRERALARWHGEIEAQERRIQDDIQSRYGEDPLG